MKGGTRERECWLFAKQRSGNKGAPRPYADGADVRRFPTHLASHENLPNAAPPSRSNSAGSNVSKVGQKEKHTSCASTPVKDTSTSRRPGLQPTTSSSCDPCNGTSCAKGGASAHAQVRHNNNACTQQQPAMRHPLQDGATKTQSVYTGSHCIRVKRRPLESNTPRNRWRRHGGERCLRQGRSRWLCWHAHPAQLRQVHISATVPLIATETSR